MKTPEEFDLLKQKLEISQQLIKIGFWELDIDSQKILLSAEAAKILHYSQTNKMLLDIDEFCSFAIDKKEALKENLLKLTNGNNKLDCEFLLKTNSEIENIYIRIISEGYRDKQNSKKRNILGLVKDISIQKHNELILKAAKKKAEESDILKSVFLANMSHEIRTPLNSIIGFAKLLSNTELDKEKRKQYSEFITNSANNLNNLIKDILDVSKIEAGKIEINKNKCYVNKILDEIKVTFEKEKVNLKKEHITLKKNFEFNDNKFSIITDPYRFHQIFVNLINNALKFTEKGSIEFGYIEKGTDYLEFYVKDSGIGIPENKLDLIFSRFGQVTSNQIKNPGGTGLGLSITKTLVEKLGGKIGVETKEGVGSTFYFTLPFDTDNSMLEQNEDDNTFKNAELIEDMRILAVEDDIINRILLSDTLKVLIEGVEVIVAIDGNDALEKLKQHDFDLIIMDIRMPNMSGYTATKKIREEFEHPKNKTPILGLSAHASKSEIKRCKDLGMNDFLTKPIVSEDLLKTISLLSSKIVKKESKQEPIIHNNDIESIQIIDLSFLHNLYNSDINKINKVLRQYAEHVPKQVANMKIQLEKKHDDKLKTTAHSLKSTFKYIGREDLSNLSKKIEKSTVNSSNEKEILENIKTIESEWSNVSLVINAKLG